MERIGWGPVLRGKEIPEKCTGNSAEMNPDNTVNRFPFITVDPLEGQIKENEVLTPTLSISLSYGVLS